MIFWVCEYTGLQMQQWKATTSFDREKISTVILFRPSHPLCLFWRCRHACNNTQPLLSLSPQLTLAFRPPLCRYTSMIELDQAAWVEHKERSPP